MDEHTLPSESVAIGVGAPEDDALLAELVTRLLDRGVVISGDVLISLAGVDLVYLGLRLVLASAETVRERQDDGSRDGDSSAAREAI